MTLDDFEDVEIDEEVLDEEDGEIIDEIEKNLTFLNNL